MKRTVLIPLTFGLLSGCVTAPAEITRSPVSAQLLAGAPQDRIVDATSNVTVRTYSVETEDGKDSRVEVVGATCELLSDHLQARVITPQEVILPKYDQNAQLSERGVPPSISVTCTAGDLSGVALLTAKPGQIVSGSGNLVVDLVLIAGSAAVAATANWAYEPAVAVTVQ